MKFSVDAEHFVNALSKLSSVIPTRSTLPILDNILFKLNGNSLQLLASDLEIFIRVTIEVKGSEDGEVAVDAKRLLSVTRTLAKQKLDLSAGDKNKITLKTKNGKYVLPGESPEDFPAPEDKEGASTIEINGGVLKKFIGKVIHAVNTDEIRRNMAGILFDIRTNELRLVATDGFRLAKVIKENFEHNGVSEKKMIVPTKACNLFIRLNNNDDTTLELDESLLKIKFADVEIYTKLIDDTFPNYESVIPKDNDKNLTIPKADLVSSLKRAEILADTITKRVKLEIKPDSITINADNPEIGAEGEETLEAEFTAEDGDISEFTEKPFTIAFNAGYLSECISQLETESVKMTFSTPSKATIAFPIYDDEAKNAKDEKFMELVMPVRIG